MFGHFGSSGSDDLLVLLLIFEEVELATEMLLLLLLTHDSLLCGSCLTIRLFGNFSTFGAFENELLGTNVQLVLEVFEERMSDVWNFVDERGQVSK